MLTKPIQEEKKSQKDSTIGSYWITTFGCQMNKADSERMAGTLEKMGYSRAVDELKADLVLYNTCTIRDSAQQKVYSFLGRQVKRKHNSPNLKLAKSNKKSYKVIDSNLDIKKNEDLILNQLKKLIK